MSARRAAVALLLCGACFGLGVALGRMPEPAAFDAEESRARVLRALRSGSRLEQSALLAPVFEAMGPSDVDALARLFEARFATGVGELPLELFVEGWARFDPQAARARIEAWPPDRQRAAWPALLGAWARTDPGAASAALAQVRDPATRQRARRPLIQAWAASDEAGLWSALAQVSDAESRRELVHNAVEQRLARGVAPLLAELEALSGAGAQGDVKAAGLAAAATRIARDDLPRALALAQTHWYAPHGPEIARRVATHWASRDARASIAWLLERPADAARDGALASAYRRWRQVSRDEATQWVGGGALGAELAPVVVAHAAALAREDPGAAIAWAEALPDASTRERSLLAVARIWRRSDPVAAARLLDRLDLLDLLDRPELGDPDTQATQ